MVSELCPNHIVQSSKRNWRPAKMYTNFFWSFAILSNELFFQIWTKLNTVTIHSMMIYHMHHTMSCSYHRFINWNETTYSRLTNYVISWSLRNWQCETKTYPTWDLTIGLPTTLPTFVASLPDEFQLDWTGHTVILFDMQLIVTYQFLCSSIQEIHFEDTRNAIYTVLTKQ